MYVAPAGRQVGFDDSAKGAMFVFETFMDLIFLIDLVINFRTGGHAAAAAAALCYRAEPVPVRPFLMRICAPVLVRACAGYVVTNEDGDEVL